MENYEGLLVRTAFGDTGVIPAPEVHWTSPDIIPYGEEILTFEQAVQTYNGPDIGKPIINSLNNNIYVRCKNISNQPMRGNVNLYAAKSSLLLLPNTWTQVTRPTVNNPFTGRLQSTQIHENSIAMVEAPFLLSQLQNPYYSGDHYCLIAVANNNNIPFGVPRTFQTNADFAKWVRDNPNVAQRNIAHYPGPAGSFTAYETFGNANFIPSDFLFVMQASDVPLNTKWRAQCADRRLPGGPFNDSGTFSANGNAATRITVPKDIGNDSPLMTMVFTFSTPDGKPFLPIADITIRYYQIPTSSSLSPELAEKEREVIRRYPVPSPTFGGKNQPVDLIELGSVDLRLS